jgi:hypothetical protein
MQDIPRTTSASDRPKKKVKVRRVKPKPAAGPRAPKPSGVFAEPIRKVSVKDAPPPKPKESKPTPSALDILPTKSGENSKPYRPPTAKKVVRKAKRIRAAAQHEARDTKGDDDRQRASDYDARIQRTAAMLASQGVEVTDSPKVSEKALDGRQGRSEQLTPGDVSYAKALGYLKEERDPVDTILGRPATYNYGPNSEKTRRVKAQREAQPLPIKLAARAANDYVDMTVNAVPGMYHLARTAVTDPEKVPGMLAQPYIDTARHPIKSFVEHPGETALLLAGIEGAVGRGAGKAMRTAPSKTTRRIASTRRAPTPGPGGMAASEARPYSKDVIHKGVQVAAEKLGPAARRATGMDPKAKHMTEAEIARRVDETAAAGRILAHDAETKVVKRVIKAKRKRAGRGRMDAATSLVAQGITTSARSDIAAYLTHLEGQARGLSGSALKRNQTAQQEIRSALKRHDEQRTRRQAQVYADSAADLERQVLDRGMVDPAVAETTRLAGAAVRRLDVQPGAEARSAALAAAKAERKAAERTLKKARRVRSTAVTQMDGAVASARVSARTAKSSPALRAAAVEQRAATAALAKLRRSHTGRDRSLTYTAQLRAAQARVRSADQRVRSESSRLRGVAPREHDRLLRSIAIVGDAKTAVRSARATAHTATQTHRALKRDLKTGALVGPGGKALTAADIRAAVSGHLDVEPAYVSHARNGDVRPAAVPTEPPTLARTAPRGGEAVARGDLDLSGDRLLEQLADTQRRISAADNYRAFLDEFGHRETPGGELAGYGKQEIAARAADDLADATDMSWSPMRDMDGKWRLVPTVATRRLQEHAERGQTPGRAFTQAWTRARLATSIRWLFGQGVEPAVRAGIGHAGPRSFVTARRVLAALDDETRAKVEARTIGGTGLTTTALRREGLDPATTSRRVQAIQRLSKRHGPKELIRAWDAWTNLTMGTINTLIQRPSQTAMLGKGMRDMFVDERMIKTSSAAIRDIAHGVKDPNNAVALGRMLDDMAGKYGKFSPTKKAAILSYSPFAAWFLSSLRFLAVVLPRDHPVLTSVIAAANQMSEDWRREQQLVFDAFSTEDQLPGFLQGSIPGKDGSHLLIGKYLPFGVAADDAWIFGSGASLILPQYMGPLAAFSDEGRDWTGKPLVEGGRAPLSRRSAAAVSSILLGIVPAAQQVATLAGVHTPDQADSTEPERSLTRRVRKVADPLMYTKGRTSDGKTVVVKRRRPTRTPALPALPSAPSLPSLPSLPSVP